MTLWAFPRPPSFPYGPEPGEECPCEEYMVHSSRREIHEQVERRLSRDVSHIDCDTAQHCHGGDVLTINDVTRCFFFQKKILTLFYLLLLFFTCFSPLLLPYSMTHKYRSPFQPSGCVLVSLQHVFNNEKLKNPEKALKVGVSVHPSVCRKVGLTRV